MLYEDANGAIWCLSERYITAYGEPKLLYPQAEILYKLTPSAWIMKIQEKDRKRMIIVHDRDYYGSISTQNDVYKLAKTIDFSKMVFSEYVQNNDNYNYIFIFKNEDKYIVWQYKTLYEGHDHYKDGLQIFELIDGKDFHNYLMFLRTFEYGTKLLAVTNNHKVHISINGECEVLKKYKRGNAKTYVQLCNGTYWYYGDTPEYIYICVSNKNSDELTVYDLPCELEMTYIDSYDGYVLASYQGNQYINGKLAYRVPFAANPRIKSARNV